MSDRDTISDKQCADYLQYLYETALKKYGYSQDIEAIIQDSIVAFIVKIRNKTEIRNPKAYLSAILNHKYNDWLRKKYRTETFSSVLPENDTFYDPSEENSLSEEYESVRREIGRLIKIYRDVTVMHYIKGMSTEQISAKLGISRGTVLSRLSSARSQIKEKLLSMEKYSEASYSPKELSLSIWGGCGKSGEPFSLASSPVEQNALILSYDKPVSVKELAETMGMPCAYLEPAIDNLVKGELMGRTSGGLVYTRCFMRKYEDSFGDVKRQEAVADKYADKIWNTVWQNILPLTERKEFSDLSEKQKATFILLLIRQALSSCIIRCKPAFDDRLKCLPKRPNGGQWLAIATVFDNTRNFDSIYDSSGPVEVNYRDREDGKKICQMFDYQSVFGDTHWAYSNFKYKISLLEVLQFYASLLPCNVKFSPHLTDELIPEFEKLHVVKRDKNGRAILDVPAFTFDEVKVWDPVTVKINEEVYGMLNEELSELISSHKNKVPGHVDCAELFYSESALNAYVPAQLMAIVNKGLLPYTVEIGKTPVIFIAYRNNPEN